MAAGIFDKFHMWTKVYLTLTWIFFEFVYCLPSIGKLICETSGFWLQNNFFRPRFFWKVIVQFRVMHGVSENCFFLVLADNNSNARHCFHATVNVK